jgi:hypothetical protein
MGHGYATLQGHDRHLPCHQPAEDALELAVAQMSGRPGALQRLSAVVCLSKQGLPAEA